MTMITGRIFLLCGTKPHTARYTERRIEVRSYLFAKFELNDFYKLEAVRFFT